jgi:hypothetical protein
MVVDRVTNPDATAQPMGPGTVGKSTDRTAPASLTDVIGRLPYRLALAGGWIDQPFVSSLDPEPPASMVVVSLQPTVRFMDRSGMATGTRATARALWGDRLPDRDREALVRELYAAENRPLIEPSGSQDMVGIVVPGISRLDYDAAVDGGTFPCHIESTSDPETVSWLERVLHLIAVGPRPAGYRPLGRKRLEPAWVRALGQSGRACFDAIIQRDLEGLGASMNACVRAWSALLPDTLVHPTIAIDLKGLLASYQASYPGAMPSGCGGGYLVVASEGDVPGSFRVTIRTDSTGVTES